MRYLILAIFILIPSLVFADGIKVTWEPSPSPGVDGYVVYCGQTPRPESVVSPKDQTFQYDYNSPGVSGLEYTFESFPPGPAYCSAIAYTNSGLSSVYSNEATNTFDGFAPPTEKKPAATVILAPGESIIVQGSEQ